MSDEKPKIKKTAYKCKSEVFKHDRETILNAVKLMDPFNRDMILMRYIDRKTYGEIGKLIGGVTDMTARRKFQKAVKELEKLLDWNEAMKAPQKNKSLLKRLALPWCDTFLRCLGIRK